MILAELFWDSHYLKLRIESDVLFIYLYYVALFHIRMIKIRIKCYSTVFDIIARRVSILNEHRTLKG